MASVRSPTLESFLPTVDRYGSILTKLLFCFMHLANEVDEAFPWFWHALFWPVCELELPDGPWLSVLKAERERRVRRKELRRLHRAITFTSADDEYTTHSKPVWEAQEIMIIKKRHIETELMPQWQRERLDLFQRNRCFYSSRMH